MENKILILVGLFIFFSCSELTNEQEEIRNNINRTVNLIPYDSVLYNRASKISFKEFRAELEYISIVYLEKGCHPCFSKFFNTKLNSNETSSEANLFSLITARIASAEATTKCEVSLACSVMDPAQNNIRCSGTKCFRNASERWVEGDGSRTYC